MANEWAVIFGQPGAGVAQRIF